MSDSNHLPNHKTSYCPSKKDLISYAPDGSFTRLPSTVTDPIAVNNIANVEFDATEKLGEEDIL